MALQEKFKAHWKAKFGSYTGCVLLAVSGGEDSMVMANLFLKSNVPFAVAHCNFGLRGEEANLDEQLVHDWCAANNIRFHSVQFETKKKSEEWKKGTQETARILRYEWFEQIRAHFKYSCIVTAHHANDNVETLLINLFKGTGISGIHGILPENGKVVRPLLFATKEMISAYAGANKIVFREDASNASDDYLRNAVRHNIVPAMQQWFPNGVENANESIFRFAQAELLFRKAIEQERKKLIELRGKDYYISIKKLSKREPLETICYELFHPFGFTSAQVSQIIHLMEVESGHYISSDSHRIIRNRDFLIVTTLPAAGADLILVEAAPCSIDTGREIFSFSIQPRPQQISSDRNIACFDLNQVEFPLSLRTWKTGDYFYPFGMKMKKKKVSRVLIDEKIPLHEKEHVRILESGKRIAWVCGLRIDERFRVKEATEDVLIVKRQPHW